MSAANLERIESDAPRDQGAPVVLLGRIALACALLIAWEIGARSLGHLFLAPPTEVALRIVALLRSGALFAQVYVTLSVSLLGFIIGSVFGVLLPLLLRRRPRLTEAVEPYIVAAMGIPKFALTPLLILWLGIGMKPKLVVVSLMVFFAVFVTVFSGVRGIDRRIVNMARVLGASDWMISRKIVWPALMPFFFMGVKVSLPRAISAALVGEFLVGSDGLGYYIEQSRQTSDTTGVFAGIAIATLLVVLMNVLVVWAERRALAWRVVDREMRT